MNQTYMNMRKMMMTAAAALCCTAMMTVGLTSCSQSDNPIEPQPVKPVAMADVLKLYTAPQSLYELDTKRVLPYYVVVNSAYKDENGETQFYDLSTITNVRETAKLDADMFDIDISHLADNGYIKLTPNLESEAIKEMLEDVEYYGAYEWGTGATLELTNNRGETMVAELQITYLPKNEQKVTMDIKKDNRELLLDLPVISQFGLNQWPIPNRNGDVTNVDSDGFLYAKITEDDKLLVKTDGLVTTPEDPDRLTFVFKRHLTGSPYLELPDDEGLMVNFRIELEVNVSE